MRSGGDWAATFTQEWPVVSQKHQFSYTLAWSHADGDAEFGNTLINYRYQLMVEGPGRPAFSPRVSLILPTGNSDELDSTGLQFNLPFSKQTGDVYWHWNAGMTWQPAGRRRKAATATSSRRSSPAAPSCGCTRCCNAMLETVLIFDELPTVVGTVREKIVHAVARDCAADGTSATSS